MNQARPVVNSRIALGGYRLAYLLDKYAFTVPNPPSPQPTPNSQKNGLSVGAIVGIAIVCAIIGILIGGLSVFFFLRSRPQASYQQLHN